MLMTMDTVSLIPKASNYGLVRDSLKVRYRLHRIV